MYIFSQPAGDINIAEDTSITKLAIAKPVITKPATKKLAITRPADVPVTEVPKETSTRGRQIVPVDKYSYYQ